MHAHTCASLRCARTLYCARDMHLVILRCNVWQCCTLLRRVALCCTVSYAMFYCHGLRRCPSALMTTEAAARALLVPCAWVGCVQMRLCVRVRASVPSADDRWVQRTRKRLQREHQRILNADPISTLCCSRRALAGLRYTTLRTYIYIYIYIYIYRRTKLEHPKPRS